MSIKQRTIRQERSIKGKSLHTGEEVTLTLKPADANAGYVFRRVDLYGKPEIRPFASNVTELVRSTTISNGNEKVHTVEHVLSALAGCGIDNAIIELDASEPPILDGSARPFPSHGRGSDGCDCCLSLQGLDCFRHYLRLENISQNENSIPTNPYPPSCYFLSFGSGTQSME